MHPASAFIKPKYFKTRVKERKARARAPVTRETVSRRGSRECLLDTKRRATLLLHLAYVAASGNVKSTVVRNIAADVPRAEGAGRGGRRVSRPPLEKRISDRCFVSNANRSRKIAASVSFPLSSRSPPPAPRPPPGPCGLWLRGLGR